MPRLLRLATFNLENFDDKPNQKPTLAERIALMRPQLLRLNADVLCLQEVNGQEQPRQPRQLLALQQLIATTPYSHYHCVSTVTTAGHHVYDERNLVILSRYEVLAHEQHRPTDEPLYRMITATPPQTQAREISWERPILAAQIKLDVARTLHVFNVHLKSKLPTDIPGQKTDSYTWKSCAAWAEGSFVSSMKRMGQAVQTRKLIDATFDLDEQALLAVCGDFNAEADDVPLAALRGDVENTNNPELAPRVLVPCERTVPESSRYSLIHQGHGTMLDHILASRALLPYYHRTEIHNELLHDESVAFATDKKFPESDHAPVVAEFVLPE
ncbi:MAG: endonuclease/exonuclease/phosphatase family protein [Candidatus Binatia bacterium]